MTLGDFVDVVADGIEAALWLVATLIGFVIGGMITVGLFLALWFVWNVLVIP